MSDAQVPSNDGQADIEANVPEGSRVEVETPPATEAPAEAPAEAAPEGEKSE